MDTKEKKGPKRIGELLVAANVIRTDVLLEALQVSKVSKSPIGRTLMSMGHLTEPALQAAIELQSLLRAGVISTEFGIRALNVAAKTRVSLQDAFLKLGWRPPMQDALPISELGELLVESGIISAKSLDEAMQHSKNNGLPLGRCLVANRVLSQNLLTSALTAQVLLRDGKINKDQAIAGLKSSAGKRQPIEQSLRESGAYLDDQAGVRLGELLTAAGLLTESDKVSAIEMGLERRKPIGQILLDAGIIQQQVLQECLKLQELIAKESLTLAQAADFLKQSHLRRLPVSKIVEEKAGRESEIQRANQLIDFMLAAKVLTGDQITAAQHAAPNPNASLGEILLDGNFLNSQALEAATQAKKLIEDGLIPFDQASVVLDHCLRKGVEFHRALQEVPWEISDKENPEETGDQQGSWLGGLWSRVTRKE